MSLLDPVRPNPIPRSSTSTSLKSSPSTPFHLQPNYLTLARTLSRLSTTLLPLSSTAVDSLDAYQQHIRSLLLSPLPHQRTKYLRTIDNARTLLLELERGAQGIKVQRTKREVLKDLAEKRRLIKELRGVIEELGRQADREGHDGQHQPSAVEVRSQDLGETVEELLGLPRRAEDQPGYQPVSPGHDAEPDTRTSKAHSPSTIAPAIPPQSAISAAQTSSSSYSEDHSALLGLRNRQKPAKSSSNSDQDRASQPAPGPGLTPAQESLTSSLLQLSQQLKSQSLHLSATLTSTDAAHVTHATTALDRSSALLEKAGRGMGQLRRMSEGEGWYGRIMLYLWIVGLWVALVLLVGVGPKLRF